MLDAGRKYWSPDYVVQTIREMAYLKLNTLQLHLSDNNAFRLVSDRFPYLAAPEAYTKADIRRFEAAARTYHVTIIPEIEMPAHAGGDPQRAARPGSRLPDVRNDAGCDQPRGARLHEGADRRVRAAVLRTGVPHRDRRVPDTAPTRRTARRWCATPSERGFGSTADVFVDFINEMNAVVRSHGKRTVIWNWWDIDQDPTIAPDKTIKVEAWTTAATGSGEANSAQHYLGPRLRRGRLAQRHAVRHPGVATAAQPQVPLRGVGTAGAPAPRRLPDLCLGRRRDHPARQLLRHPPAPATRGDGRPGVGRPTPRHGRRPLRARRRGRLPARRARARAAGHAHRHAVRHQPRMGRPAEHLRQGLRRRPVDVLRLRRAQRRLHRDRPRRRARLAGRGDPVRAAQRAARARGRRPVRGLHRRAHHRLPDAGHGERRRRCSAGTS